MNKANKVSKVTLMAALVFVSLIYLRVKTVTANIGQSSQSKASVGAQIEFVNIPAGQFLMGSENGDYNRKPVHRVRISRPFEMGKYEVTQAQWQAIMGNNPRRLKGANLPVEDVSWNAVQEFIKKLNARNDGYTYRLPTEAEWEYACRAGETGDYSGKLDEIAWYQDNSGEKTHAVGTRKANAWGLHDMYGNVYEWCQDRYGKDYYEQSPNQDPAGPDVGTHRVIRGGCFVDTGEMVRLGGRDGFHPEGSLQFLGFRLVRTAR